MLSIDARLLRCTPSKACGLVLTVARSPMSSRVVCPCIRIGLRFSRFAVASSPPTTIISFSSTSTDLAPGIDAVLVPHHPVALEHRHSMAKSKKGQAPKPKMTKEERRAKYTQIHRDRQRVKDQKRRHSNVTCFQCRQKGHAVADCPMTASKPESICYKCGSTEHSLHQCSKRNGPSDKDLPFATCFVCKGSGHLSSQCPENEQGLYVNGGCCKHCGSKQHLGKECPTRKSKDADSRKKHVPDVPVDDLLEKGPSGSLDQPMTLPAGQKRRVVKF